MVTPNLLMHKEFRNLNQTRLRTTKASEIY